MIRLFLILYPVFYVLFSYVSIFILQITKRSAKSDNWSWDFRPFSAQASDRWTADHDKLHCSPYQSASSNICSPKTRGSCFLPSPEVGTPARAVDPMTDKFQTADRAWAQQSPFTCDSKAGPTDKSIHGLLRTLPWARSVRPTMLAGFLLQIQLQIISLGGLKKVGKNQS